VTGPPAIVIETGFITNRSDLDYIVGNKAEIARAIALGIMNYNAR